MIFRRYFPWTALKNDRECAHLIFAWSSGKLPRQLLSEIFPNIGSQDIVMRRPEARVIGWSLDLQELAHLLTVAKSVDARRVLEIGTYDGFSALNLAANVPEDGEIVTIDLPDGDQNELSSQGISNATTGDIIGSMYKSEPERRKS